MAVVPVRKRWIGSRAPRPPFRLNLDSPQAEGLRYCVLLTEGGPFAFDLTGNLSGSTKIIAAADVRPSLALTAPIWFRQDSNVWAFQISPKFTIPGSPFTMLWRGYPTAWGGGNPGLFRTGTTASGTIFMIFQGTSGRPWIRWNGINMLQPGSGYGVPLNQYSVQLWSSRSGEHKFWDNGILRHSSATASTDPTGANLDIHYIGSQFDQAVGAGAERVVGEHHEYRFYDVAGSDALAQAAYDPGTAWDLYEPRRTFVPVPAAAGVSGDLAATEAQDTFAATGSVLVQGDLAATEAPDSLAAVGQVIVQGDIIVTEAPDVAAMDGQVLVQGDLAATEAQDTALFVGEGIAAAAPGVSLLQTLSLNRLSWRG